MDFSLLKRWFWPSPGDAVSEAMRTATILGDDYGFIRGAARLLIGPAEAVIPTSLADVISLDTLAARYPYIDLYVIADDFLSAQWVSPEITWPAG